MKLGDVANAEAAAFGKPLEGVRVLAVEQMQSLPFATQMLARLGADVVKVESLGGGDQGRGSQPSVVDESGANVGATFLRNNLNKRSIAVNLKSLEGQELVLSLAEKFDIFAENGKAGGADRLGIGFDAVSARNPKIVYLSISGFGNGDSPYSDMPAFAPIVEAMSGIYEFKRQGDNPPVVAPVGALGDIGTGLFGLVGVLAALRQRDRTGEAQYVDVAMLDAMVAMTDLVTNYWSLGLKGGAMAAMILDGFRAKDGWFIIQVAREFHFERLATCIGHDEWLTDERLAQRQGWVDHMDDIIRPGIEAWASDKTKMEAARVLGAAGVASGPCSSDDDIVADPHVDIRNMLVECPRTDGVEQPVLVPGNPIKMSGMAEGPETRVPHHGEHTTEILSTELDLAESAVDTLREQGIVA